MEQQGANTANAPLPQVNDPDKQAQEEALWKRLEANLGNTDLHKEYASYILKNNLIKIAMRRYSEVVEDKEKHPVDHRRLARQYQQNLVKVLFFTQKSTREEKSKRSSLQVLVLFFATVLTLTGLFLFFADTGTLNPRLVAFLKILFPLGLTYVVGYLWILVRKYKSKNNNRRI